MGYAETAQQINHMRATLEQLKGQRTLLESQRTRVQEEKQQALQEQMLWMQATKLLQDTASLMRTRVQSIVEPLLTAALRTLLGERAQFRIVYRTDTKNPQAIFTVSDQDGIESSSLEDSFGGGVMDVCALLLRAVYVLRLGLPKVMFLDEPLSSVHGHKSIEIVSGFIHRLCVDASIQIVLITGEEEMVMPSADKTFKVSKSGGVSQVEVLS